MVRVYKRKTNRNSWSKASLKAALADIKAGNSIRRATQSYQIPRVTEKTQVNSPTFFTGIVPLNRYKLSDADFAPADVTDIARFADSEDEDCFFGFGVEEIDAAVDIRSQSGPLPSASSPSGTPPSTSSPSGTPPSTSSPSGTSPSASSFNVSPLNIRPLPKSQTRKAPSKRKREKSAIITSSPNRSALKAMQANKGIKDIKKQKRAAKPRFETGKGAKRKRVDNSENVPQDTLCCHCGAQFSASVDGEGWNQCIGCQCWNHDCVPDECSCLD